MGSMSNTKLPIFTPNATIIAATTGSTPYVLGCITNYIKLPVGYRVRVIQTENLWATVKTPVGKVGFFSPSRCMYLVQCPDPVSPNPGCIWSLWIGSENYPANDKILLDS